VQANIRGPILQNLFRIVYCIALINCEFHNVLVLHSLKEMLVDFRYIEIFDDILYATDPSITMEVT